jgi:hypothetical protein
MTLEQAGLVDLVEAATRLRISYHTAHRMVITGRLKGRRLKGHWAVDLEDLERLVNDPAASLQASR